MKMPRLRLSDDALDGAEYLTTDGLAKLFMVTRQSISKLTNDTDRNFPKPFPLWKTDKREKHVWSKKEVVEWLEKQRSEKVT